MGAGAGDGADGADAADALRLPARLSRGEHAQASEPTASSSLPLLRSTEPSERRSAIDFVPGGGASRFEVSAEAAATGGGAGGGTGAAGAGAALIAGAGAGVAVVVDDDDGTSPLIFASVAAAADDAAAVGAFGFGGDCDLVGGLGGEPSSRLSSSASSERRSSSSSMNNKFAVFSVGGNKNFQRVVSSTYLSQSNVPRRDHLLTHSFPQQQPSLELLHSPCQARREDHRQHE